MSISHAEFLKPFIARYRDMGMDQFTAVGLARIDIGLEDCQCCAPTAPTDG